MRVRTQVGRCGPRMESGRRRRCRRHVVLVLAVLVLVLALADGNEQLRLVRGGGTEPTPGAEDTSR